MLKPGDNQDGYQTSSVLPRASNLRDVDFLLIHGTGDGESSLISFVQLVGVV